MLENVKDHALWYNKHLKLTLDNIAKQTTIHPIAKNENYKQLKLSFKSLDFGIAQGQKKL